MRQTFNPTPSARISGAFLLQYQKPYVYVWWRDTECLYVGSSTRPLGRLGRHDKIGVVEPLLPTDVIDMHECVSEAQMLLLESILIQELNPRYNIAGTDRDTRRSKTFTKTSFSSTELTKAGYESMC